jgi:hypothetical protein
VVEAPLTAVGAALEATDDDGAFRQIDVVPAQIAGFGYPQAMPVDQQADQPIAVAAAIALERGEKFNLATSASVSLMVSYRAMGESW